MTQSGPRPEHLFWFDVAPNLLVNANTMSNDVTFVQFEKNIVVGKMSSP